MRFSSSIRYGLSTLLLLSLCLLIWPAGAQDANIPLILLLDGDFWAWDEGSSELRQLTKDIISESGVLSPDGTRLAYVSDVGEYMDGVYKTDIGLLDIRLGKTSWTIQQTRGQSIIRSIPAWSPDSKQLVWVEWSAYSNTALNRVIVYDLATGTARTIVDDFPAQCVYGGIALPAVAWHLNHIIVSSFTCRFESDFYPQAKDKEYRFWVFDTNGTLINNSGIIETENRYLEIYNYIQPINDYQILVPYYNNAKEWVAFDLLTGEVTPPTGILQIYSQLAPNYSIYASLNKTSPDRLEEIEFWRPDNTPITELTGQNNFVLSPDGQAVAYLVWNHEKQRYESFIRVWRNDKVVEIPTNARLDLQLIWGPTAWRVLPVAVAAESSQTNLDCPGTLPPHLKVGGKAIVLPNSANNLRHIPSLEGDWVGQIPAGGTFLVGDGPVCSEGHIWWEVYYKNSWGWTVESQGRFYYLESLP